MTVVGRQWWWEYRYKSLRRPQADLHHGQRVAHSRQRRRADSSPTRLPLESADVCHSFWVPRLEGKVDLIPGRTNTLWLQTSEPGLFLGQCAEYCGTQHAHMLLRVIVDTPEDFERWLDEQAEPARRRPGRRRATAGDRRFCQSRASIAIAFAAPRPRATYAPDLTHLMSRQTLASGMFALNRENLRRWVHDPQDIKPGCLMPAFGLSGGRRI